MTGTSGKCIEICDVNYSFRQQLEEVSVTKRRFVTGAL